jgi:hypothetical protein
MKHFIFLGIAIFVSTNFLISAGLDLVWVPKTDVALPAEIAVYTTSATLNGRAFKAWYAIADMSTGNIELRSILSTTRKTPSAFVTDYGNDACVCTNGGYFDTSTSTSSSYSLVVDQGSVKAGNIAAVTRSGQSYYPTRGALGVDKDQHPSIGWSYSLSGIPWLYPAPSPNVEGASPQAQPGTTFPVGGSAWNIYSAIGGAPVLLKNGINQINNYATNYELLQSDIFGSGVLAPRTAIGYTGSGKIVLLVCDGRQVTSQGATLDELAQIMSELGCTDALNLDGGGSTAMITGGTCVNNPSDGSQRAVASAVMFAKRQKELTLNELWNITETSGGYTAASTADNPNWTYASTYGRAIAAYGDYIFVPIRSDGSKQTVTAVRVINADTGKWLQNLSMNNVSGGTHVISCAESTSDGKILVSNLTTNASTDPFKIYMYDANDLSANPVVLLSFSGNASTGTAIRLGDTFTFEGSINNGRIRIALSNTSTSKAAQYFVWNVQNGAVTDVNPTIVNLYNANGTSYTTALGGFPRVYAAGADSVWIKGSGYRPVLFVNNKYAGVVGTSLMNNCGNAALPLTYQERKYLAVPDYSSNSYTGQKAVLIDVTSNISGSLAAQASSVLGTSANVNGTDGVAVLKYSNGLKLFYLSASEGVAAYTIGNPPVDVSTGMTDQHLKSDNCVANVISDQSVVKFNKEIREATLFSSTGQIIKTTKNQQMEVSGMSGIFLIRITDKAGNHYSQKIILP